MSFQHLHNETPAERVILVDMKNPTYACSDWNSIRANVLRRAVSHVRKNPTDENNIEIDCWWDDHNATGFRNCSWSKSTVGAIYTECLSLRGQIDTCSNPLACGRPYANKVMFRDAHNVDLNTAKAMFDTLSKWDKFCTKHSYGRMDSFPDMFIAMAKFLKIDTFLFRNPDYPNAGDLSRAENFVECNLAEAIVKIEEMLRPFYKNPKE